MNIFACNADESGYNLKLDPACVCEKVTLHDVTSKGSSMSKFEAVGSAADS